MIARVFQIKWGDSLGTAFAIDRNNRQYLITARHVVEGIAQTDNIEIYHEDQWKHINVSLVGSGEGSIDVAILSCSVRLAPPLTLVASAQGISHGQPLYFLGFPFGWRWETKVITDHKFPTPFVKAGILSGALDDFSLLVIDGHGNQGFSGGPVVFQPDGPWSNELRVAGVVSSLPSPLSPIVNEEGCIIAKEDNAPLGYVQENAGFIVAVTINHAIELIDANPIGLPLADDHSS
ncbi:MAG: serine protease [Gammaproteobacteria bacterium]|nr:serine protease [Gammaproteobacteria bacterium]